VVQQAHHELVDHYFAMPLTVAQKQPHPKDALRGKLLYRYAKSLNRAHPFGPIYKDRHLLYHFICEIFHK
jgi:hypothetical protein